MNEDTLKELNSLSRSNLLKILITNNVEDVEISENLRGYFLDLFSQSCNSCKYLKRQRDMITCPNMGGKTSSSENYTVSQMETEIKQFHEFCKENNLSEEVIANICKPILPSMKNIKSKWILYFGICIVILTVLYLFSYSNTVDWHYSALGRMFLIELLPVWNWKVLKNEKCMIKSQTTSEISPGLQDCTFCEYIHNIDVIDAKETEFIYRKYVKMHKPVILENGLEFWMDSIDFHDVITNLLTDKILSNSYPCQFKSNTNYANGNLYKSLKNILEYPAYFAHFQNCEFDAVKAFRKYFPRPEFLAAEISPIQYSWVLLSDDYAVEKFKEISLSDQIAIVGQLHGKTDIILIPNECPQDCELLMIELEEGEVLIFSGLWNMEYRPSHGIRNMAVILEAH